MFHPIPPKKLIKVALPLDAITVAAAREKSIRHGYLLSMTDFIALRFKNAEFEQKAWNQQAMAKYSSMPIR